MGIAEQWLASDLDREEIEAFARSVALTTSAAPLRVAETIEKRGFLGRRTQEVVDTGRHFWPLITRIHRQYGANEPQGYVHTIHNVLLLSDRGRLQMARVESDYPGLGGMPFGVNCARDKWGAPTDERVANARSSQRDRIRDALDSAPPDLQELEELDLRTHFFSFYHAGEGCECTDEIVDLSRAGLQARDGLVVWRNQLVAPKYTRKGDRVREALNGLRT